MGEMKINIRSFKGQRFNVTAKPTDKIQDLVMQVAREAGLDYNEIRLISQEKDLSHNLNSTVEELGIADGSTIMIALRLPGGQLSRKVETA